MKALIQHLIILYLTDFFSKCLLKYHEFWDLENTYESLGVDVAHTEPVLEEISPRVYKITIRAFF